MIRTALLFVSFALTSPMAMAAATCSVNLESTDAMKFNMSNIDISKKCKAFTINLKHTGKLAKNVMGHNVAVALTSDIKAIDSDGIKAGLAAGHVKPGDARVIAHSKLIGGGESASVSFPVSKLSKGAYSFFCTFPGHSAMMKGTITLKP